MDILSIISVALGVAGLGYALYQGHERRKLVEYNKSEAWYLYEKANNMTGITQTAFSLYKNKYQNNLDPELIEVMAKSGAFGLELFRETIRLIQLSEEKFDYEIIDEWQARGKISDDDHKALFTSLVVNHSNNAIKQNAKKA